jgi:hypothetical protein
LSAVIAEKVLLSELMLTCGTDPPVLPEELLLPLDGVPLLPQAATTSAALPASAVSPTLFETENNEIHLVHERDVSGHVLDQVRMTVTAGRIYRSKQ